jgi:phosphoribosylanthranilate isomerase
MKLKICGMKYDENIRQLAQLDVDMLGFIFYPRSSRFVDNELNIQVLDDLPKQIEKVAVFVDEPTTELLSTIKPYGFDYIQLHGNESPADCEALQRNNIKIIKAFSVDADFDFSTTAPYEAYCEYFLFDTKGLEKGGNGLTFNWRLLDNYRLTTPFFLSGGIGVENIEEALHIKHPQFSGVDINSKIELAPALKSFEHANYIVKQINQNTK